MNVTFFFCVLNFESFKGCVCFVDVCCSLHGVSVDVVAGGVRPERPKRFLPEPTHSEELQRRDLTQHESG